MSLEKSVLLVDNLARSAREGGQLKFLPSSHEHEKQSVDIVVSRFTLTSLSFP
jgi:hypothetical protein